MITTVTLDNSAGTPVTIHEVSGTAKRALISAKGLVGLGTLRAAKRVRPSAHGSINETRWEEGRTISLEGEITGATVAEALAEFRAVTTPMLQTLDVAPALLKWEETGGNKLQMAVKLDSDILPVMSGVAPRLVYQAALFGEDPRAYSQTQTTVKGSALTGTAQEATWLKATTNSAVVFDVKVDSAHIYWVDGVSRAIGRATIAGGTIEKEWVKTVSIPTCIAVDAGHIYWGTQLGQIGRAAIGGGTVEPEWANAAAPSAQGITAIAVKEGANIFYTWGQPYSIGRMTTSATSIEQQWLPLTQGAAYSLALDTNFLYFGFATGIGRSKINGEEVNATWLSGSTGTARGLAVNATNIFWTSNTGSSIGRALLNGTEPNINFISGLNRPTGLAINTEHIYWGEPSGYIVRSKELTGGGPVGSNCVVSQAGSRPAPLIFKINGPVTNPAVIRKSDGMRITLRNLTVTAGNFVELNVATRTALWNGFPAVYAYVDPQNTNWAAFEAPSTPGTETYQLTGASATAATLEVLYRSAYS